MRKTAHAWEVSEFVLVCGQGLFEAKAVQQANRFGTRMTSMKLVAGLMGRKLKASAMPAASCSYESMGLLAFGFG